jgi:hypothetical protein
MRGDQQVHRADHPASFLERRAQAAVCGGRWTVERDDHEWQDELVQRFTIPGGTPAGAHAVLELRERYHRDADVADRVAVEPIENRIGRSRMMSMQMFESSITVIRTFGAVSVVGASCALPP